MIRPRIIWSVVALTIMGALFGGRSLSPGISTAASRSTARQFTIGFSNGFSGNTWRTEMLTSLQQEEQKKKALIKQLVILDGQGSISKQIGDVRSLMAQHVDALLIIPNAGSSLAPVVAQATGQGIVAVPFNLPLTGNRYNAYVGTDPAQKGTRLAECLASDLHNQGKIIALGGIPGNSYTAAAWGAAQQVLKRTHIQILTYRDAYWQEDRAKTITADLLASYPHIDGIWADGAQDAAGAVKAFLAAGRSLPVVTGDDYNGMLKLYMKYHTRYPKLNICLLSEPTWESRVALDTALDILQGKKVPKTRILTPTLITGANAAKYVRPDLPDGVFVDTDLPPAVLKKLFH
jgi:ribose transport system substrate-binding protein